MERLTLTETQQASIAAWLAEKANDTLNPMTTNMPGTNLVPDDHLEIDHNWKCVVLGGGNEVVYVYVPDWGWFSDGGLADFFDLVTDRAGPNGEIMPIIDPVQMQARTAAAAAKNPKHAAHGHHVAPRTMQDLLDAQTPETRKALEEQLKKHHLLHGKGTSTERA
jgi:hypothetical protein